MGKMREKYESGDIFTWTQVHNLFPIVVAIIGIALAWGKLTGDISVMNNRLEYLEARTESLFSELRSLQGQANSQKILLDTLPLQKGVQGASVASGKPTKTPTPTIRPTRGVTPEVTND